MNTTKVNWEEVNLPINNKTINELGVGHYLIETKYDVKSIGGFDALTGQTLFNTNTKYGKYLLEVHKISNGLIGVMNGLAMYEYKHETIVKISRLDF